MIISVSMVASKQTPGFFLRTSFFCLPGRCEGIALFPVAKSYGEDVRSIGIGKDKAKELCFLKDVFDLLVLDKFLAYHYFHFEKID
ncbi:hypothetical protein FXV91_09895 [Methanosarcina sp. DH2]|nr:hypothetical protein [Methanosarcina sp. DH2]